MIGNALPLLPLLLLAPTVTQDSPDNANPTALELWYRAPAERWEEALPVGNGRLGAMVFGGTARERLALNEDSIWAGSPLAREREGAHRHLTRVRDLLFEGQVAEAQRICQEEFMSERLVRSYQPLGDLTVEIEGLGEITDYRRWLDLENGVAGVSFREGGGTMERLTYASVSYDVLVHEVRSDLHDFQGFIARAKLSRERNARTWVDERGRTHLAGRASQVDDDGNPVHEGVSFHAILDVWPRSTLDLRGDEPVIRAPVGALFLVSAATDYAGGNPQELAEEKLDGVLSFLGGERAVVDGMHALRLKDHEHHRARMGRVVLDLGGQERRALPTDERLEALRRGEPDPDLLALYFQYGRHLLLSCSRPGSLPANLQGLWNPHIEAPWNSDYHININCQMNYWPALVTNLFECHEPFFDLVDGIAARGERTARELYDAPGWVAHHTTDAWWFTAPIGQTVWGLWPTGGAWCTRHLWEHYLFTQDVEFLRERAWPLLRSAAWFFVSYLSEDPATQKLVSGPSSSPENRFRTDDGQEADVCMGASMDQEIVWDLFTNTLEAAEVLGIDSEDELVGRVALARERLAWPGIGEDGRILEWSRPYAEVEPGHRHMSHLFGLHPGRQFTQRATPEYVAAAQKSLEFRLANGGGHTGWSRAWIANFYARLRHGDEAYEQLLELLRTSTLPNLFDDHPPFQIDGNFGGTAAVAEMLLQSHEGVLHLLPALPEAWRTGWVGGLRARGGATVAIAWRDGALEAAELWSPRAQSVLVRSGEREATVELAAHEALTITPELFEH